jgi:hypothetical protein
VEALGHVLCEFSLRGQPLPWVADAATDDACKQVRPVTRTHAGRHEAAFSLIDKRTTASNPPRHRFTPPTPFPLLLKAKASTDLGLLLKGCPGGAQVAAFVALARACAFEAEPDYAAFEALLDDLAKARRGQGAPQTARLAFTARRTAGVLVA